MQSITMTDEQTERYDADDRDLMVQLNAQAQTLADQTGETVEIYTADGVVANAVTPG